jgi:adenylate cyclase
MSSTKKKASPAAEGGNKPPQAGFMQTLRKRRIIETTAAFIGGGWLIIEFVDRILVAHYHFPDKTIDITFITLFSALVCTLIQRWFSGRGKPRRLKAELFLIPLILLITLLLDINLLLHLNNGTEVEVPSEKGMKSIAVLPFVDMSPQKDQEYFCDGMTDELITRLSRIRELRVPARTSVFMFKGKAEDSREIGRKLAVRTLLEGSIRKAGDRLRITAQLINVADGFHIWSEVYNRELKDIFAVQDEIAQAIAGALKITLLGEKEGTLLRTYTPDLEAYNPYLQGRYFWNKRTEQGILESQGFFRKAIDKDPAYALAYVGLADSYISLGEYEVSPPKEVYPKAKWAAQRALEIDPGLGEAHVSMAMIMRDYDWDWAGSESEFKKAIELMPNYPVAHQWYAEYLANFGRFEEAFAELRKAEDLDPLSLVNYGVSAPIVYLWARQYDQALAQSQKAIDLDANYAIAYGARAFVFNCQKNAERALSDLKKSADLMPLTPMFLGLLGEANALAGRKNEAEKILGDLREQSEHRYISPVIIAGVYKALGQIDEAFVWLEKGLAERAYWIVYLNISPQFDFLRSDARFRELVRKIGLEK